MLQGNNPLNAGTATECLLTLFQCDGRAQDLSFDVSLTQLPQQKEPTGLARAAQENYTCSITVSGYSVSLFFDSLIANARSLGGTYNHRR